MRADNGQGGTMIALIAGSLFLAAFGLVGLVLCLLGRLCGKSEAGRENGPNATGERCAVAHTLDPIVGNSGSGE